jgi:hypothetical protein
VREGEGKWGVEAQEDIRRRGGGAVASSAPNDRGTAPGTAAGEWGSECV